MTTKELVLKTADGEQHIGDLKSFTIEEEMGPHGHVRESLTLNVEVGELFEVRAGRCEESVMGAQCEREAGHDGPCSRQEHGTEPY